MEHGNANGSKRRAEGTTDEGTETKKSKTTPRSSRTRQSIEPKNQEASWNMSSEETKRLFDDLKSHFDKTSQNTTERFEKLIQTVDDRVTDNAAAISELRETVRRIEGTVRTPVTGIGREARTVPSKDSPEYRRERYEAARKMLRLWPVRGKEEDELRSEALRFIRQKLQVCHISCTDAQVIKVRRTKQPRKTSVNNEVLVIFQDKYCRDQVVANAKHLSSYRLPDGRPSAGLRMNYPDHLSADFRVLDWYGAELNRRYPGTKRNIRFDDDVEGLRMDVKVPHNQDWYRVYPEMAKEIRAQRSDQDAHKTRMVLETPPMAQQSSPASFLTGGNSVLKAPILSNTTLLGGRSNDDRRSSTVTNDPDEVIYISPTKRTA